MNRARQRYLDEKDNEMYANWDTGLERAFGAFCGILCFASLLMVGWHIQHENYYQFLTCCLLAVVSSEMAKISFQRYQT